MAEEDLLNRFSQLPIGPLLKTEASSPEDVQLLNTAIDQRLSSIKEDDLVSLRERGASRLAASRIEKELYERSMGRRHCAGSDGGPSTTTTGSQFVGTWKEFFTVVGIMVLLMMIIVGSNTGPGAGQAANAAANLFGTIGGIYIFAFFVRRRRRR